MALAQRRRTATARRERDDRSGRYANASCPRRSQPFATAALPGSTLEIGPGPKCRTRALHAVRRQARHAQGLHRGACRAHAGAVHTAAHPRGFGGNADRVGASLLRGTSDPAARGLWPGDQRGGRLAAVARTLDAAGRQTDRAAVVRMAEEAQAHGILRAGDAAAMAEVISARCGMIYWSHAVARRRRPDRQGSGTPGASRRSCSSSPTHRERQAAEIGSAQKCNPRRPRRELGLSGCRGMRRGTSKCDIRVGAQDVAPLSIPVLDTVLTGGGTAGGAAAVRPRRR